MRKNNVKKNKKKIDEMIENIGYNDKRYRQLKKVIPGLEPGKINSKERQK